MFADAFEISARYTRAVAVSRLAWNSKCSAGIGTYIVLNDEGWVLTAGHILDQIKVFDDESVASAKHEQALTAIDNDAKLNVAEKSKAKRALGRLKADSTRKYSPYWDIAPNARGAHYIRCPVADLGAIKIDGFDKATCSAYPKLKDPTKGYRPGTSLCRLGYPFHTIEPTWSEATGFVLPSWPPPLFPIEGIFTRVANIAPDPKLPVVTVPYPAKAIETSSAGFKGQSGGPIFDVKGHVWGVQCVTASMSLGFDPVVPGSKEKVHQFINVGYGVHIETVIGFLADNKIKFEVSSD